MRNGAAQHPTVTVVARPARAPRVSTSRRGSGSARAASRCVRASRGRWLSALLCPLHLLQGRCEL